MTWWEARALHLAWKSHIDFLHFGWRYVSRPHNSRIFWTRLANSWPWLYDCKWKTLGFHIWINSQDFQRFMKVFSPQAWSLNGRCEGHTWSQNVSLIVGINFEKLALPIISCLKFKACYWSYIRVQRNFGTWWFKVGGLSLIVCSVPGLEVGGEVI